MFSKLKEKLKGWIKKTSSEEENVVETKETKQKPESTKKPAEDKTEKVGLPVPEKIPQAPFEKDLPEKEKISPDKSTLSSSRGVGIDDDKKIAEGEKKEIPVPQTFNVGTQAFEPDIEKIKELTKEIETEKKKIEKLKKTKTLEQKSQEIEQKEVAQEKKKGFFANIIPSQKTTISEKQFEVYSEELEMLLLENNVAYEVAEKIINELKERVVGKEFLKKEIEGQVEETLKDIIREILIEPFDLIEKIKEKKDKPFVIVFCGINGTGKTTTIAKVAKKLQEKNLSCVMAAADTFRAASIEQIQEHAQKIGVKLISHEYGSDPAAVGFDAINYAKKNRIDVVLIDTAGRMHSEKNLLKELEKVVKVNNPDLKIFVGEAITGNDAVEQVKSFDWAIGIDAVILTKADTDEKGGTALSLGQTTKKPILYLGVGQEYKDLIKFEKETFIKELGL